LKDATFCNNKSRTILRFEKLQIWNINENLSFLYEQIEENTLLTTFTRNLTTDKLFFYSDNLNSGSRNGPNTNMEETKENVYWTVQGTFVDNYARCHRHFSDVVKMRKSNFILNDLCLLNHKYKKIFNSIYKVTFSVFKNRKSTVEICLSCIYTMATIALSYMFFVYAKYFIRYLKRELAYG